MLKTMLHTQLQASSTVFSATVSKNEKVLDETIIMEISTSYKGNVKEVQRWFSSFFTQSCKVNALYTTSYYYVANLISCEILDGSTKFHAVVKSSFTRMSFMSNQSFRSPLDTYKRETKEQTGKKLCKR